MWYESLWPQEPLQDYCKAPDIALKWLMINWCALLIKSLLNSAFQAPISLWDALLSLVRMYMGSVPLQWPEPGEKPSEDLREPQAYTSAGIWFKQLTCPFLSDYFYLVLRVGWWQQLLLCKGWGSRTCTEGVKSCTIPCSWGEEAFFGYLHSSLAQFLLQLAQLHSSHSSHILLSPGKHSKAILQKRT